MDRSCGCRSPVLRCPEDNSCILGSDDEEDPHGGAIGGGSHVRGLPPPPGQLGGGDGAQIALTLQSEECLSLLVLREAQHLPREDYAQRLQTGALDASLRRDAIEWIEKVHAHYNFGPLSAYLSVNYLDRFLSVHALYQGKAWMMQLLSVTCLSLAAKMEETDVPLSLDLQVGEPRFIFEARTIQRMELLVLSTLKWRMQAVTPFSYIDYFLHKFGGIGHLQEASLPRSAELILNTNRNVDFLQFRPSEVAAAVALSQSGVTEGPDISRALCCCNHIDMGRVMRCYDLIQDMMPMRQRSMKSISLSSSALKSPIGVLDAACLSYKSVDTMTLGSQANSERSSPDRKRRRLDQTKCLNAKGIGCCVPELQK